MAIALQIERNRGEKGGFMSLQSMGSGRMDTGFGSDTNLSSLGGSGSGFGPSTDVDSFSTKSKGLYLFYLINMLFVFSSTCRGWRITKCCIFFLMAFYIL